MTFESTVLEKLFQDDQPMGGSEVLRHASIQTTGDVYVQTIDKRVLQAVNSRTDAVLEGWTAPVGTLGLKGRNLRSPRAPKAIRRSSAKSEEEELVSA